MNCKHCGRIVETSIEGELICQRCWDEQQMPDEEQAMQADIRWYNSHCQDCDKPLPGGGVCPECLAERNRVLAELGWD